MLKLYPLERMSFESRSNTYTKIPFIDMFSLLEKMKKKKYPSLETVPKSNRKIIDRGKSDIIRTEQMHDRSLSWISLAQNKYMIAHFPGYH
jgi:hypothetical protein